MAHDILTDIPPDDLRDDYQALQAERDALKAQVQTLHAALRPFAFGESEYQRILIWAKENKTYTDWTRHMHITDAEWAKASEVYGPIDRKGK